MEPHRIDAGTSPGLAAQGATAAADGGAEFEALISDRGVELTSARRNGSSIQDASVEDESTAAEVRLTPAGSVPNAPTTAPAEQETTPVQESPSPRERPGAVNGMYNQHGRNASVPPAASPLGQALDVTG